MTNKTEENEFFNSLKNRMKSNADKMKEETTVEKSNNKEAKVLEEEKGEDKVINTNKNESNNTNNNKQDNKENNNTNNKDINESNNNNYNKSYNKDKNNTEKNEAKIKESINGENNNEEIRRTYYLRKSIVNDIDSFAKKTGNNKSYLVELALTYFLNQPNLGERLKQKENSDIAIDPTKLVIPNQKDKQKVRRTYYLKEDMIDKLDDAADSNGEDKSFIVEEALKFLFENAEVK